jgi:hypothetical protein
MYSKSFQTSKKKLGVLIYDNSFGGGKTGTDVDDYML